MTVSGFLLNAFQPASVSCWPWRCSGGWPRRPDRPLPTAIDTPLGRLDSGHRGHLVERYFPFASHQVLLLSTDEEIAGDYLERLSPWIGRIYALEFDDAAGATRISEGYFPKKEAA